MLLVSDLGKGLSFVGKHQGREYGVRAAGRLLRSEPGSIVLLTNDQDSASVWPRPALARWSGLYRIQDAERTEQTARPPKNGPRARLGLQCRVWGQFCRQCEEWNQTIQQARFLWREGLCNFHASSIWLPIGNRKSKRFTFIIWTFLLPTFPFGTSVTFSSPWGHGAVEPGQCADVSCFLPT